MESPAKAATRTAYEAYADRFAERAGAALAAVRPHADAFRAALVGRRVVDAGAGPGQHARYFSDHGLDVLCLDNAAAMVRACRSQGLAAVEMDLEDLILPARSVDGVWAYASLLHLPKAAFPRVLGQFAGALAPGTGLLGLCLFEGVGEGLEAHSYYPGVERYFAYFTDGEVRAALAGAGFRVLSADRAALRTGATMLHYLARCT